MRLKPDEVSSILEILKGFFATSPHFEVRLYGSRANDNARGGDIDLVVIWHTPPTDPLPGKHFVLAALKNRLGDQKIDLSFLTEDDLKKPFWCEALKNSILLV